MVSEKTVALNVLRTMPDKVFEEFLYTVPRPVLTRIENGTSQWEDVLPKYYVPRLRNIVNEIVHRLEAKEA